MLTKFVIPSILKTIMPATYQSSVVNQATQKKNFNQSLTAVFLGKRNLPPMGNDILPILDDSTKLDLALEAIEYAQNQKTSVAPVILNQLAKKDHPPEVRAVTSGSKERAIVKSPDAQASETASGQQVVEFEKNPEISPEVAEYVQRVEDHADQLAEPIVVDGQQLSTNQHHHPTQPVIVLPISTADEKKARFKSVKFSIKWLVEFSHKIIKEFVGSVIYRQAESSAD